MNEAQLRWHWWAYGINEGRRASPTFDVEAYARLNPTVAAALGPAPGRRPLLINHYITTGAAAGLPSADDFWVKEYIEIHSDLVQAYGTWYWDATEHFLLHGYPVEHRPGRKVLARPLFDVKTYKAYNSDIDQNYSDYGAVLHWLEHGIAEGRRASFSFHAPYYKALNPSLAGLSHYDLLVHFWNTGMLQGLPSAEDFHENVHFTYHDYHEPRLPRGQLRRVPEQPPQRPAAAAVRARRALESLQDEAAAATAVASLLAGALSGLEWLGCWHGARYFRGRSRHGLSVAVAGRPARLRSIANRGGLGGRRRVGGDAGLLLGCGRDSWPSGYG